MRIVLPRASRGIGLRRLWTVEFNNFDIEEVMPSLFYRVITKGRNPGTHSNKPQEVDRYFGALSEHPRLVGFEGDRGRRLLERWARATIVEMSYAGRSRHAEQVEYVVPHTILCYKTGLPWYQTRQRNVHVFVYDQLIAALEGSVHNPSEALRGLFLECFGRGVTIGDPPQYDGTYDGSSIDIHALFSIAFIDGFDPVEPATRSSLEVSPPALRAHAHAIGRDVIRYLRAYRDHLPVQGLMRDLLALLNFELYVYSAKLAHATNQLVQSAQMPPVLNADRPEPAPPKMYVDFTRERRSVSDRMSQACVDRDIEEFRRLFDSTILLRTIDRFVELRPEIREELEGLDTPEYLKFLVDLRDDPMVVARAAVEMEQIREETRDAAGNDQEREEVDQFVTEVTSEVEGDLLRAAVRLLIEAQQSNGVNAYIKWIKSAGGLNRPYGLIVGNERGPRAWRYVMSDDLLNALVHLALVDDETSPGVRPRFKLRDFLSLLTDRFGLLIDRPPDFLDDAERRAAATRNLEALKRRLRQMGFFEDLSDDFAAQYLTPTVGDAA